MNGMAVNNYEDIRNLARKVEALESRTEGRDWEAVFVEETAATIPYTFVFENIDSGLRPIKAHKTDAAFDLRASFNKTFYPGETHKVGTGVRIAIPDGMAGLILPRSGHASAGLTVANAPGLIDSGYRGEVGVLLAYSGEDHFVIRKGDRIAQLLIIALPLVQLCNVSDTAFAELSDTDRGDRGFGSTGLG